jgi:hypothetical protein
VEKLKDADDVSRYISTFKNARHHFAEMVFQLLHSLSIPPEWVIFKCMTMSLYSSLPMPSSSTSTPTTSMKMTFATVISLLSEEANCLCGEQKLTGPGSEYTNATLLSWPLDGKPI